MAIEQDKMWHWGASNVPPMLSNVSHQSPAHCDTLPASTCNELTKGP